MEIFDIGTVGTSLTACNVDYIGGQWQETLARALEPGKSSRVRVYNVGAGGTTSTFGLANIARVLQYRPRLITIEYNMNDCATSNSVSVAQSETNHRNIIASIQASLPETLIYLMTMNPPISTALTNRPNINNYNNVYRNLAATLTGVGIIDTAPSWAGSTTTQIPDGVHPTLAAQNSIIVPAIAAALAPHIL